MRGSRETLSLLVMALLGSIAFASTLYAADEPPQPEPSKSAEKKPEATKPVAPVVSYYKDIRPILQEHCQGCHQPAKKGGDYLMTDFAPLLKGGESGKVAVVAGKPAASYLIEMITPDKEGKAEMPQEKKPLAATQIETIAQWITSGAMDDTPASAKQRFDADHPPVYHQPPVITALDVSPDGALTAVSGYHETLLHRTADLGKSDVSSLVGRLIGVSERVESLAFSPDGKTLAVAGGSPGRMGEIQLWNVADRTLILAATFTYDTLYGVSWSPDGSKVAFGCGDNSVRAMKAETGEQILFQGAHSDWVLATTFSGDGAHLISASRDRSLKLIDVPEQRFVDNITSITPGALKGGLAAVQRRPKAEEVVVGGSDGTPKLFRIFREKGKDRKIGDDFNLIRNFEALPGRVYTTRFNADGSKLVAGSSADGAGELRVYGVDDAKPLWKNAALGPIFAAAFTPEGNVVAGGYGGEVYVLDAATGAVKSHSVPVPVVKSEK